ncbi:MAG: ABC transporter permease subunit [Myxococcota bacterium]
MSANGSGKSAQSDLWRQFSKRKVGLFSLYFILLLFAVAVYAPLLANHNPLALKTTYGTLYRYYYAGWKSVHEIVADSVANREKLAAERAESEQKYAALRGELLEMTTRYNEVGNRYESTRNQSNRLQDQMELLSEEIKALGEGKATAQIQQREALEAQRKELDVKVKEAGAEKASLKRELDLKRVEQDGFNEALLRINFRTHYPQHATAIMKNLNQLQFPVDEAAREKIRSVAERYDEIFAKLVSSKGADPALSASLDALYKDMQENLSPAKVESNLVSRWTFPALAALDWVDRTFMIGYLLFLIVFVMGTRLSGSVFQKAVGIVAVALLLSSMLTSLRADLPTRNYKALFLDNVSAGISESYAIMAPIPYGFNENRVEEKLQRPRFWKNESGKSSLHILGTDDYGRDVLSRLVWGARVSLSVGFVAVSIYVTLGIIMGAIAGFFGGWVDVVISRFIEVVICFPSFFLILAVIAFIGPSIYNVMVVIGLTSWTGIARLTRGEFLRLRNLEFVLAAEAQGVSKAAIMFRHILPNALTPVMVSAAFGFAGSILTESGLSFLGFGVQEPFPSWGQMLSDSQSNPLLYWWLFIVPGIALFVTVTSYNLAGNAFRDAADPRLRQ